MYNIQIALGNGDVPGATIRTAADENLTMTFSEAQAMLVSMSAHGAYLMNVSWTLKNTIDAETDYKKLQSFNIDVDDWNQSPYEA